MVMLIQSNPVIIAISASILIYLSIYLCFGFIFFVQMLFSVESDKSSEAARRVTTAQLHNVPFTTRLLCTATLHVRPPVQCFAGLGMPCGASGPEIFAPYGPSSTYITNSLGSSSMDDGWIDPRQPRPGRGLLAAHHLRRGRRSTTAHSETDWRVWSADSCALITWNAVHIDSIRFNLIASFPLKLLWFCTSFIDPKKSHRV